MQTDRNNLTNAPNRTRVPLTWGAERVRETITILGSTGGGTGGITKLSELIIDVNKDWLQFGISRLGTLSIVSPLGTYMGYIHMTDNGEFRLVGNSLVQKLIIDAISLHPASANALDVGSATYPLRKVIIGSDTACRMRLPVGTMMCD
jgi:hypothetical protein